MEYNSRYIPFINRLMQFVSGFYSTFGWMFYSFGIIFISIFVLNADLSSIFPQNYDSETNGIVISSRATSITENNRRIHRVTYRFTDLGGREHIASSYSRSAVRKNTKVVVQYSKKDPEISNIRGMRSAPFGASVLFILLFPLIGLIFILLGIRRGIMINRLLKFGEITTAVLERSEPTRTRINNRRVYKYFYKYTDRYGVELSHVEKTHLTHLLNDSKEKELLFIPGKPKYGAIISVIPGNVGVVHGRELEFNTPRRSFLKLLIPAGGIIATLYVIISFTS